MINNNNSPALRSGLLRMLDNTPHLVLVGVDAAHEIVVFNQGAERLLGFSAREVLGAPLESLLADVGDLDRLAIEMIAAVGSGGRDELALYSNYLSADEGVRHDWRLRHRHGHTVTLHACMDMLRDETGTPIAMLIIANTLPEQQEARVPDPDRLALSQQIFESSPDGIVLFDRQGLIDCNQRALDLFHVERAAFAMMQLSELSPPEQPNGDDSNIRAAELFKEALVRGSVSFEWMYRRRDGEDFPCEVVISRFNYHGKTALQACLRDISGRKRAEMEVIKSRELFAHFMRYFPGCAWLKDDHLRFAYVNRNFSEAFGLSDSQWMGHLATECLPVAYALESEAHDLRALERRETINIVEEAEHADGSRHFYLSYKFPVVLPDNSLMLGGISMDITSIKLMEQQLAEAKRSAEQAARAKSFFLANMSHEIRTPLNGILCMLDILADGSLNADQEDSLRIVRESADALLGIVNDVLDFSKIESGKLELESLDFDLRNVLTTAVDTFSARAQQKGLLLKVEVAPTALTSVRGDALRLRQILLNLLSNAIKFTEHGSVTVSANTQRRDNRLWLDICVRDTGIGIAADARTRLFQSFSQLESSTTRRFGGTGLGLVICRQLAELMGGSIGVESRPGNGSAFWVHVPLEHARMRDATLPGVALPLPVANRKAIQVLVVDDNVVNQAVARKALERLGHSVTIAANGEEALYSWLAGRYDLIFMDCQMPVMDGYEAVRRIRDIERIEGRTRQIIVAMTASALAEEKARCLACGMDDFLAKPVKLATLAQMVERWSVTPHGQAEMM